MNIAAEPFLKERYYQKGEDWEKLCHRVAKAHAESDDEYEEYYNMLYNCDALPNSPVLMNSGRKDGYLSACNLVEIPDDLWGIFMSIAKSGMIQKQGGGCCAKGTIIPTVEFGFVPIESIKGFDSIGIDEMPHSCIPFHVFSFDKNTETFTRGLVTHLWKFEKDVYYSIRYGSRGKIEVTPWHRFLVWNDGKIIEKRADEISVNDWLLTPSMFDRLFENEEPEFWWLYGYFLGDGSIDETKNGVHIRFFDKKQEFIERASSILFFLTGHRGSVSVNKRTGVFTLSITARPDSMHGNSEQILNDFFKRFIHLNGSSKRKNTPLESFLCPNPFAFIGGLIDSDGYVGNKKSGISCGTEELAHCIMRHLSLVGVNSTIRYRKDTDSGKRIKGEWFEVNFSTGQTKLFPSIKKRGERFTISRKMRVKSVERIKEKKTFYDFTVERYENYLAGSEQFVSIHNTGFNFSKLRPNGDVVGTSGGTSSGVVSFLKGIDATSAMVKQGGRRRGANMGLIAMWHPDVMEFIQVKHKEGVLETFNLSIGVTGELFAKADNGEHIIFINPRTGEPFAGVDPRRGSVGKEFRTDRLLASELEQRIAQEIWHNGEPGLIFWDTVQKHNTTPWLGNLQGINPCGEVTLLYNESCCLGSINLVNHLKRIGSEFKIDYEKLENTTRTMVRFLNRIIDNNTYPFDDMKKAAMTTRKIGLGIMGFADMLLEMGIEYGGKRCMHLISYIMSTIVKTSKSESRRLAKKDGPYPAWKKGNPKLRNANILSIAPTGGISWITGVSSGIEPVFDFAYMMRRKGAEPIVVVNKPFLSTLDADETVDKNTILERLIQMKLTPNQMIELGELDDVKYSHFVTAKEILPETHIRVQAAFQRFIDLSISKTINLPYNTTVEEIKRLVRIAHRFGCKGITLYRDGSHREAFLQDIQCPNCDSTNVVMAEGCMTCIDCKTTLCINA